MYQNDHEEDVEANDKNPLSQMKKLRDDKIKEESLLNNDKGLSFKRLSSFYSRGNKNNLLLANSNSKELNKFLGEESSSFENNEYSNEKKIKSKIFNNNNYYSNSNKNKTAEEKKSDKEKRQKLMDYYGWALVDGSCEKMTFF